MCGCNKPSIGGKVKRVIKQVKKLWTEANSDKKIIVKKVR